MNIQELLESGLSEQQLIAACKSDSERVWINTGDEWGCAGFEALTDEQVAELAFVFGVSKAAVEAEMEQLDDTVRLQYRG